MLELIAAAALALAPAQILSRLPAPEANQGVAVDPGFIYAIDNSVIAKYDRATGQKVAAWTGDAATFPHLNSCAVIGTELVCASSNYPTTPMQSSVEVFDPVTMTHLRSVALGVQPGSLTWIDRRENAWWACFANYDGKGGEPPRDHRHTTLVKFDDQWRRLEGWALPPTVLDRIAPMSISGGGWGPDGKLYLSGHDLPELYVMQLPDGGGVLDHLDTIGMEAEGQAIDWDESQPGMLYGITRRTKEILAMKVPPAK